MANVLLIPIWIYRYLVITDDVGTLRGQKCVNNLSKLVYNIPDTLVADWY